MGAPLRKLTVLCPKEIEAVMADALDALEPRLPGYTVLDAQGRGANLQPVTAGERVRGARRMAMFVLVLPEARVADVTEAIRIACPRPQIAYWTEPVEDFGRLTDA